VPLNIVLNGAVVYHLRDLLQSKLATPATIERLAGNETPEQREALCANADVLVAIKNHDLPPPPRLKLLQVAGAGLDQIDFGRVPPQAWICNAYGHDVAGAEYIVLSMLAWCHEYIEAHESFKGGTWRMSGRFGAPLHEELSGKTVGILGLGSIGLATARLAKPFGTTVIGVNRTVPAALPPSVDEVRSMADLPAVLPRCDFVAICLAQAPETTGLIDRTALAAMKPTAVIINVSRGPIVDEQALFEALRDRTIGGAVIDAWYRYPPGDNLLMRPSELPFHELPNLIMTPHSAVWTRGMVERRWSSIARNIDAIARGDTSALEHVVLAPLGRR
jgi:phosphoglycerate dehydrogenase-like enzyme